MGRPDFHSREVREEGLGFRREIRGGMERMSENEVGEVTLWGNGRSWLGGIEEGFNARELGWAVIRGSRGCGRERRCIRVMELGPVGEDIAVGLGESVQEGPRLMLELGQVWGERMTGQG